MNIIFKNKMLKKDINFEKERNHSSYLLNRLKNSISSTYSEKNNFHHNEHINILKDEIDQEKIKIIQNNKKLFEKHMTVKLNSPIKKNYTSKKINKIKTPKNNRNQFEKDINQEILNINKYNLHKSNLTIHPQIRLMNDNEILKRTHLLLTEKTSKNRSFKEKLDLINNINQNNKFISEMLVNNKYHLNTINNKDSFYRKKKHSKKINDKPTRNNSRIGNGKEEVVYKIESKKKTFFCIPCF